MVLLNLGCYYYNYCCTNTGQTFEVEKQGCNYHQSHAVTQAFLSTLLKMRYTSCNKEEPNGRRKRITNSSDITVIESSPRLE